MAKSKNQRDPGAPKRNLSAYLLYQNAMRDTFKAHNPGMTFGQLSKYTSAMYAEMPPQEKETWSQRSEADKNRFLLEMASYVPAPGFDARGDAVIARMGGGYRSRTSRDSNAPKRNLSAYLLYQNAMRNQFKNDNPGMTFGQLSKYTSHMYKSLTKQERAEWELRSQQDKARFDEEMMTYVPPPGHDAQGNLLEDRPTHKRAKKVKDPNAPKRARGSFVLFTFEVRPKIMIEFPNIKFVEMGSLMGERWRALTPEQKSVYENQAKDDKLRFNVEMAAYTAKKAEDVARSHAEMVHAPLPPQQMLSMPGTMPQYAMPPQSYIDPHQIYDQNHYSYS
eukprot:CAMPEP_0198257590 /NCGR_PEP_ID=MMETSP1447-20131203/7220_1 /TAXON_ID=420782 /ORGANISM="Chaetoceros dichaeta, Strain CCMP1751" /LENGTH=334 /DNA_ID=CAMNT_0043944525 /DNA_START=176 /DNA_END=1180 /DNA_ORIENTATION=+